MNIWLIKRKKEKDLARPWRVLQGDTKKRELLKTPTKIEEIQEKKIYWQKLNHYNLPFKRQYSILSMFENYVLYTASSSTYAFFHCHYAFQKFPFVCVTLCVLHALQNATPSHSAENAQWLRCCTTNRKVAGSIPDGVIGIFLSIYLSFRSCDSCRRLPEPKHWNFSLTYSFRSQYGSGVDSASNRNEYQEDFLGVNAACA